MRRNYATPKVYSTSCLVLKMTLYWMFTSYIHHQLIFCWRPQHKSSCCWHVSVFTFEIYRFIQFVLLNLSTTLCREEVIFLHFFSSKYCQDRLRNVYDVINTWSFINTRNKKVFSLSTVVVHLEIVRSKIANFADFVFGKHADRKSL